jgi:hypothetical protein
MGTIFDVSPIPNHTNPHLPILMLATRLAEYLIEDIA